MTHPILSEFPISRRSNVQRSNAYTDVDTNTKVDKAIIGT